MSDASFFFSILFIFRMKYFLRDIIIFCSLNVPIQGASVEEEDKNGKTPRQLAVGRRHRALIKYLDTKDSSNFWDWR